MRQSEPRHKKRALDAEMCDLPPQDDIRWSAIGYAEAAIDESGWDDEPYSGIFHPATVSERLGGAYRVMRLREAALEMLSKARPFVCITGCDNDSSELSGFGVVSWPDMIGASISFCVDDTTYTVFENPVDNYRSSADIVVARAGNRCKNVFSPCGVIMSFSVFDYGNGCMRETKLQSGDASCMSPDIVSLVVPGTEDPVLEVGTSRHDEWYPSCRLRFSPRELQRAFDLGVSVADEMNAELASSRVSGRRRTI